ncbi:MAG TPA: LPS export ABC transporter periplasmic protein LptC [Candidatus Binataceae bacterium]|nr:LPS export ABC transporter periplasmic protein LptC [Candidatus Binataceae bacterium]
MNPRRIARLLTFFGTAALVVIVVVTVIVVRRRSAQQKLEMVAAVVPGALLHAHNFNWTQMRGGQSQWVLKASDASYSNNRTSITLLQPRLSMVAQDGKHLLLTASRAVLTVNGNHIQRADMSGGLMLDYGAFVLTTDRATFLPDDDQLHAPGTVKISGPGLDVAGIGLSGHPKAQTFQLLKEVKTLIKQQRQHAKVS